MNPTPAAAAGAPEKASPIGGMTHWLAKSTTESTLAGTFWVNTPLTLYQVPGMNPALVNHLPFLNSRVLETGVWAGNGLGAAHKSHNKANTKKFFMEELNARW